MHKMVVPYSSNVCENSLIQWNVWLHWLPRENVITMSPVLVGRNFSSVDILLTFTLCKCNVMTLLNNLSGTGPWPIPLKINVMTFSKSHDIKVMTLVFRPTEQISWHSASNVLTFNLMTLGRWHSTKSSLLVKMEENHHNTCVIYLLNGIDKHFHSFEMFLACLKINMKHSKSSDVETCRLQPVTSQCTICFFPYSSNVCENSSVQWKVWIHQLPRENVTSVSETQFQLCWHFADIHVVRQCQCNVMTLLNNLSGTGACRSPCSEELNGQGGGYMFELVVHLQSCFPPPLHQVRPAQLPEHITGHHRDLPYLIMSHLTWGFHISQQC